MWCVRVGFTHATPLILCNLKRLKNFYGVSPQLTFEIQVHTYMLFDTSKRKHQTRVSQLNIHIKLMTFEDEVIVAVAEK